MASFSLQASLERLSLLQSHDSICLSTLLFCSLQIENKWAEAILTAAMHVSGACGLLGTFTL